MDHIDIYAETANRIANQVAREQDDLLLSWLEPYGITRDNIEEYATRILIEESCDGNIQRFFLDGDYIFTVEKIWEWDTKNPGHVSANVTFKQYFEKKRTEEDD